MTDRAVTQASEWWVTLDQFLDRAERVLSCELARREDLATVGTSGKFIASLAEGQPVVWSMERSHPPESDVESAAARLRPLFLQDERVQHGRVTNALGAQGTGAGSTGATTRTRQVAEECVEAARYWLPLVTWKYPQRRVGRVRNDRQIAHDFLYDDLVHAADDARQRLRGVPRGSAWLLRRHGPPMPSSSLWPPSNSLSTCGTAATKPSAVLTAPYLSSRHDPPGHLAPLGVAHR